MEMEMEMEAASIHTKLLEGLGLKGAVIKRGIKPGCNYARLILGKQGGISPLFARGENNNRPGQIKTSPSDATPIVMQIPSVPGSPKGTLDTGAAPSPAA